MTKDRRPPSEDAAHDVLAAEEFGVPAPDPGLHHGPVTLPGDPSGIAEPHDVLAAEEFAMPAPTHASAVESGANGRTPPAWARYVAVGALALALFLRFGRKRRA